MKGGLFLAALLTDCVWAHPVEQAQAQTLPDNAYAISYGRGWACAYGHVARGEACDQVAVPQNARLTGRGDAWECIRGFQARGATCSAIEAPANGFLTEYSSGRGWDCERGFVVRNDFCEAVNVPDNAYLDARGLAVMMITRCCGQART